MYPDLNGEKLVNHSLISGNALKYSDIIIVIKGSMWCILMIYLHIVIA